MAERLETAKALRAKDQTKVVAVKKNEGGDIDRVTVRTRDERSGIVMRFSNPTQPKTKPKRYIYICVISHFLRNEESKLKKKERRRNGQRFLA